MRNVLLQLFHPLQGRVLGFSVFQQSSHVEHVVQVRLDLHLEFVALRVLQFLKTKTPREGGVSVAVERERNRTTAYMSPLVPNTAVFSKRGCDVSASSRQSRSVQVSKKPPSDYFLANTLWRRHISSLILPMDIFPISTYSKPEHFDTGEIRQQKN